ALRRGVARRAPGSRRFCGRSRNRLLFTGGGGDRGGTRPALLDAVMNADELDQGLGTGIAEASSGQAQDPRVASLTRLEPFGQFAEEDLHGQFVAKQGESTSPGLDGR